MVTLFIVSGCIREQMYKVPEVTFTADWSNGTRANSNEKSSTRSEFLDYVLYIYPQSNSNAEPFYAIPSQSGTVSLALLPGSYKILMHNKLGSDLVAVAPELYETLSVLNSGSEVDDISAISQFMALSNDDAMREIEIVYGESSIIESNKFVLKPISVSRNVSFFINSEQFGEIISVEAKLEGVGGKLNMSTLAASEFGTLDLPSWTVSDNAFSSSKYEVLGFNSALNSTVLYLYVKSKDSGYPFEQPVDLTQALKDLEGDEIEVHLDVEFKPDIRVRAITIKQWLNGNYLEVDIS